MHNFDINLPELLRRIGRLSCVAEQAVRRETVLHRPSNKSLLEIKPNR